MFGISTHIVEALCFAAAAALSPVAGHAQAGRILFLTDSLYFGAAPQALPDTTYASAAVLDYRIEVADTLQPGKLRSLDDAYAATDNILTFRGSPLRNAAYRGHVEGRPTMLEVEWVYKTAYDNRQTDYGTWGGGTGWTGQPLYVRWADTPAKGVQQQALAADFSGEEIIVGSLCGDLCFIDYATGQASRAPFPTGNPIKGTPSIDPTFNGNLYVGQGIPCEEPFGALVFNLFENRQTSFLGRDPKAWRGWNAFDSSAIVAGEFVFRPGENGTIYKMTRTDRATQLHSLLRYRVKGRNAPGIESSMAVYRNYGYVADNHGNIMCINLDNLRPVWRFDNGDDTDATPVIEIENGVPMLYVGSELDKQGDTGFAFFTKLNGLNGLKIWQQHIPCQKIPYGGKVREGGMFSTPLLGDGDSKNLIITVFCGTSPTDNGTLTALDKTSGEIVYRTRLAHYSWSSPVALYNDAGEMFLFVGDVIGNAYLIEGATGRIISSKRIGWNFESSPIVIGNHIVVGSRGREIYKIKVE